MIDSSAETGSSRHEVLEIDLSVDKIPEPLNAYRVNEGRYGIASFSSDKPYLITYGLSACKGLVLYDKDTKTGLLSHLSTIKDVTKTIDSLSAAFGQDLSRAEAFVVSGEHQAEGWPTTEEIARELSKKGIKSIYIDSNSRNNGHPRGISLNLATGELNEIDNSKRWSWSDAQDTSINHWVE